MVAGAVAGLVEVAAAGGAVLGAAVAAGARPGDVAGGLDADGAEVALAGAGAGVIALGRVGAGVGVATGALRTGAEGADRGAVCAGDI